MLSRRQLQVVALLADGMEQKAIAQRLGISRDTVRNHTADAYARLGVQTAAGAVARCFREGWIE